MSFTCLSWWLISVRKAASSSAVGYGEGLLPITTSLPTRIRCWYFRIYSSYEKCHFNLHFWLVLFIILSWCWNLNQCYVLKIDAWVLVEICWSGGESLKFMLSENLMETPLSCSRFSHLKSLLDILLGNVLYYHHLFFSF